jgi:hypothetical protein
MERSHAVPSTPARPPLTFVPTGVWSSWHRFAFAYLACHWLLYSFPKPLSSVLSIVVEGGHTFGPWLHELFGWRIDGSQAPW